MVIKNAALVADAPAQTEIFYPETDGMPMPDALYQLVHFVEIISILKFFFRSRKDVAVSGDNFIYFREGDLNARVAPDCFALIGGNVASLWANNRYLMWEAGKAPDFVLEIGSPSTWRNDLGEKRDLYASLGVVEYWMFDPSGGEHYGFALRGETLVDGEYRLLDMRESVDGGVWGYSAVLGLEFHWEDGRLRFYDPVGGNWLENMEETGAAREAAEDRAQAAELELEAERARAQAAQARADRLEAELRRLRGE